MFTAAELLLLLARLEADGFDDVATGNELAFVDVECLSSALLTVVDASLCNRAVSIFAFFTVCAGSTCSGL